MGNRRPQQQGEISLIGENPKRQSVFGKRHGRLVEALYELIELKDMRTASHCKGVEYYSQCIGKKLNLNQEQMKLVKDGARLHDIGKIMVDVSILNKKSTLNDRERMMIHCHAEKGMQILESFHVPDVVVDIAWHHHERWDGNGYPEGLKETDILLPTRIVTAADMLDAMLSNRPYRDKLSYDEIMRQFHDAKGSQLDPEIADIIIGLICDKRIDLAQ